MNTNNSVSQNHVKNIWPRKENVIGVGISVTSYDEALNNVITAASERKPACISHLAVHGLVHGNRKRSFGLMLDEFNIVAPDGQPVRLALNLLYNTKLQDRCYGPEFMIRVCGKAAHEKIGVYLYGSQSKVVEALKANLIKQYPGLNIVGCEPSVFRELSNEEDWELVKRINDSNAGIVFIGLGCPRQEIFAYNHKDKISAVQICVGAAFDFHAGNKKMAPKWMQGMALEWFYRLLQEPKRLFTRYFFTNTIFLYKLFLQLIRLIILKIT